MLLSSTNPQRILSHPATVRFPTLEICSFLILNNGQVEIVNYNNQGSLLHPTLFFRLSHRRTERPQGALLIIIFFSQDHSAIIFRC